MNNQPQYEKNPNGGYLNKSNYGADSWYGKVTLTPELTGVAHDINVLIEVKDIQTTQYGECRRAVAKKWVPKAMPQPVQQPAQPAYQQAQQPMQQAQPSYAQPAQQPMQNAGPAPIQSDDIPF